MAISVSEGISTIDISAFISPTATEAEKQEVVDNVREACTTYGFFQAVGHGVTVEEQKNMLACTKRFFALPEERRMEVHVKNSLGEAFRGWEAPLIQTHHEGLLPDTKETFLVGEEIPHEHPDAGTFAKGPNLWPKSISEEDFKTPVLEYQSKMLNLAKVFLKILSRGLPKEWGCSDDVLSVLAEDPSMPMRLLHYAPQPIRHDKQFGGNVYSTRLPYGIDTITVADHTDFGCITILLQELGSKGLEVLYPPTQTWIPIAPKEGAYVINMSDMMQKWTTGYYKSARHRVITTSDKDRYSVAFFLNGNLKLNTLALDGSGEEVLIGEHIRSRLVSTLGDTRHLIKS